MARSWLRVAPTQMTLITLLTPVPLTARSYTIRTQGPGASPVISSTHVDITRQRYSKTVRFWSLEGTTVLVHLSARSCTTRSQEPGALRATSAQPALVTQQHCC